MKRQTLSTASFTKLTDKLKEWRKTYLVFKRKKNLTKHINKNKDLHINYFHNYKHAHEDYKNDFQ